MAHIYRIHVATPGTIGDIATYLKEHGLVSSMSNIQTNSVQVEVLNKEKFLQYLRKKDREPTDPGWDIINPEYLGETGKAAPRSKEGIIASRRVHNFLRRKKHKTL